MKNFYDDSYENYLASTFLWYVFVYYAVKEFGFFWWWYPCVSVPFNSSKLVCACASLLVCRVSVQGRWLTCISLFNFSHGCLFYQSLALNGVKVAGEGGSGVKARFLLAWCPMMLYYSNVFVLVLPVPLSISACDAIENNHDVLTVYEYIC